MTNSPARSAIDVGSVIAGTYTIEALIGRGGMGSVFLASHNRLPGKKVAIKVLLAEMEGDEILARFKREAQIASLLSHPNIVHIEDYNVTADGMPYLVLEYLQGESLSQRLKRGPMPLDAALRVIRQVGSALAAAHAKGIVHRDLKPQNIFLVPSELDGNSIEIAKVLDFGISKMRDSQTLKTQESALLGTPQYMAPEQATGQHDKVDERTDIFALGAIVYEMLAGHPAFSGQTIPEVVFKVVYEQPVPLATRAPDVSEAVRTVVTRAMSKDRDDRFADVSTFVEALTGSPVSSVRGPVTLTPPAIDGHGPTSASGRTPNTSREAFDQTIGSGDHRVPPLAATLPTGSGESAAPFAKTVSSAEIAPPAMEVTPPRRTLLLVAGVLAAAAVAGGVMYTAMRRSPAPPAPPASNLATAPVVTPAAADAALAVTAPIDAAVVASVTSVDASVPAGSMDASVAAVATAKGPRPPPTASADDPDDDSNTGRKLREAGKHIARADWDAASRAVASAIGTEGATDAQLAKASALKGVIACNRYDEGAARAALRSLAGRPRLRLRVVQACHQVGLLATERL